jgi:hypothetical protein
MLRPQKLEVPASRNRMNLKIAFVAVVLMTLMSVVRLNAQHVMCFPSEGCAKSIVVAVYNEFPGVISPRDTVEESISRGEELLRRIIWHFNLSGIKAGRQKNPSGAISNDKLAAFYNNSWHAIDIATNFDIAGREMQMVFAEVPLPNYVEDAGIADGGSIPPSSSDSIEELRHEISKLKQEILNLEGQNEGLLVVIQVKDRQIADHYQGLLERDKQISVLHKDIEELVNRPLPTCSVTPSWVKGFGIGCRIN